MSVRDLPWRLENLRLARRLGESGPLLVYGDIRDAQSGELLVSASLDYCLDWIARESKQELATQLFLEALESDQADQT